MAMRVALDTNRYTDLCRNEREVVAIVSQAEAVVLPFIVLAELRAGFVAGSRGLENERVLRRFLAKPGVAVVFATEATTRCYADLFRWLRQQGRPIPSNDLWIAALAVEQNLALCTRDAHFQHLPQLNLV
jgi:tRNA(fMet)-specific endonuclease VapC